ncbi:hypothetical protein AAF712_007975 [Marasmius tenuissimus]|uniref:Uncharacterized protein n=1 Tax=Marasmius tenuissimus TaxID=585030 RepID=A0ABR2ZWH6_9AGAR
MRFLSSSTKSKNQSEEAAEHTANDDLIAISEVSGLVLETLQDVARLAPAPYLSDISSVALRILKAVKTSKENTQCFEKLGVDTCNLVYAIVANCLRLTENNKALSADLQGNLRQLSSFLKQVEGYIDKQSRRSRISRFLTHKSESEAVRGYRDGLKHCLHSFGLQPDITIHELATKIEEQRANGEPVEDQSYAEREGSDFHTTFSGFSSGSFSGNFRVDNVAGDQRNRSDETHSFTTRSFNGSY